MYTVPPAQLSHELREARSPHMRRRRQGIALSLAGAFIGGVVGAYQTGLLKRLPDILPGSIWDAERVDASEYAYELLQTADGLLMLNHYGITAVLIGAGGADRARRQPALPLLAAAKAGFDFVNCLRLAREEWQSNKALCSWCQVATAISGATFAATLPEAVAAASGSDGR